MQKPHTEVILYPRKATSTFQLHLSFCSCYFRLYADFQCDCNAEHGD